MKKPTTTNPDIRKEALERAHVLATQLGAQINVTYGNGGETFREMADHLQDSYMWAVAERIDELQASIEKAIYGDKAGAA
jgi:hypothetical protein